MTLPNKRKRSETDNPGAEVTRSSSPSRSASPSLTLNGAEKRPRTIGPAMPPAPLDERPEDDASSSDDDFGPALPPGPGERSAQEDAARRANEQRDLKAQEEAAKPQREEWMLLPPKQDDWSSRVDPTKLRNRKFNTGKGAKAPGQKGGGDNVLWTETPEQKRQRLEDEVMGIKQPATEGGVEGRRGQGSGKEEGTAKRIQDYNDKNRNKSLYDEHKKAVPREKEDDPSARAFDKEKDIGLGVKIGHAKRKELLHHAADFGSKFAGGKYL
ncbi:MAG: hypothetical protein M1833_002564 [Piccolia ochrophora]|nr:MAG: hypothetical protein M1833_002564 [Piccolia ochrophora]